jgi:dTDP-4-amino-4,6-dideoxygalactose transaminase
MDIANRHHLFVVEDAAQAIDSYYTGHNGTKKVLGSIGHMAAFSFHETKNIISGEGGMLVVNDKQFEKRAEIIWEKGTNRSAFFRGEVDKYGWVDIGSSFLPSEIMAAFLWAQLETLDGIQDKRKILWNLYHKYFEKFAFKNKYSFPLIPDYATNNAHLYYLNLSGHKQRAALINHLKQNGILAVFHYQSLHKSTFFSNKHDGRELPHSDHYSDCLLRLPMFYELSVDQVKYIIQTIKVFLNMNY